MTEAPDPDATRSGEPGRRRTGSSWARATVGYALVAVVVSWPVLLPGKTLLPADVLTSVSPYLEQLGGPRAANPLLSDAPFQFFPWIDFVSDELQEGRFPEWNPHVLGGVRVTPNGFVSAYYPGFWPMAFLEPLAFYDLFILLHLVVGALGVFWFARTLGVSEKVAWVAGLMVFVAAPWARLAVNVLHLVGMVWLPWALAATGLFMAAPSRRRAAGLAFIVGLWVLGGGPQFVYFGMLAIIAYALVHLLAFRREQRYLVKGAGFVGALTVGVALAAPVVLPSIAISDEILRQREPVEAVTEARLPPEHMARLVLPDSRGNVADGAYIEGYNGEFDVDSPFMGVTTLLLAMSAAFVPRRRETGWLLGGAAVALILAFMPWPNAVLHAVLPGYDRFRVSARWVSVIPALLAPAAALGLAALVAGRRLSHTVLLRAAAGAALLGAFWFVFMRDPSFSIGYSLLQVAALAVPLAGLVGAVLVARRSGALALAIIAAAILAEAIWHSGRWLPNVDERDAYPDVAVAQIAEERGGRLLRIGLTYEVLPVFAPNLPMAYGVDDLQGTAVLFPTDQDRYLRLLEDYGDDALRNNTAPPILDPDGGPASLLDAADVRTILAVPGMSRPSGTRFVHPGPPRVYARESPGPALVVPRAEPVSSEGMWKAIADPGWDPRAVSYVPGLSQQIRGGPGSARLIERSTDGDRWDVNATRGGFLRVSGRYDEGWTATVDGRPVEVHRADGIFRGVVIPSGRHEVAFDFANPQERTGRIVSALALMGLVALIWPWRRFGGRRPATP